MNERISLVTYWMDAIHKGAVEAIFGCQTSSIISRNCRKIGNAAIHCVTQFSKKAREVIETLISSFTKENWRNFARGQLTTVF